MLKTTAYPAKLNRQAHNLKVFSQLTDKTDEFQLNQAVYAELQNQYHPVLIPSRYPPC